MEENRFHIIVYLVKLVKISVYKSLVTDKPKNDNNNRTTRSNSTIHNFIYFKLRLYRDIFSHDTRKCTNSHTERGHNAVFWFSRLSWKIGSDRSGTSRFIWKPGRFSCYLLSWFTAWKGCNYQIWKIRLV